MLPALRGGILDTGNYPGRARSGGELRADAEFDFSHIPGKNRFNLHTLYAETGGKKVLRDELEPEYFKTWMSGILSKRAASRRLKRNPVGQIQFQDDYRSSEKQELIKQAWEILKNNITILCTACAYCQE